MELNRKLLGYGLGIIAAATYGMNPLFALPLYGDGMDSNSVLLFRYLFAIPIVALMIRVRGRSFRIGMGEVFPLAVLGMLMSFSSLALFESYNHMAASIASTLLFVYPLMVAVIMTLFYKEKLTAQTVVCLVLALGGIYVLYAGSGEEGALSLSGMVWVMLSSLSYAIYIVAVNRPRFKHIPTLTLTFYVLLFGLSLFLAKAACTGAVTVPHTPWMWANILALSLLPTTVSFLCTTAAIQYIGSTPTAILGVFEPVTAIIFGITVFGETLTASDVAGIIMIVCAVSLVIAGSSVSRYLTSIRRLFPKIRRHR